MAYTEPKVWVSEPLTSSDMNTYVSDNLVALHEPPTGNYLANEASDITTTSTSFVDVDNTLGKFSQAITTTGGDIMVSFCGSIRNQTGGNRVFMALSLDGTVYGGTEGIMGVVMPAAGLANPGTNGSFVYWFFGVAAGTHTVNLMWRVDGGTGQLYRGAAAASGDIIPQFVVREVS